MKINKYYVFREYELHGLEKFDYVLISATHF